MGPVHGVLDARRVHPLPLGVVVRGPQRVHGQRGQAAPAVDALVGAGPAGVRVGHGVAGVHADQGRPVVPPRPAWIAVHVAFEQLAVTHVDGLGDHVRIGVLRDGGVDHPRAVVLGVHVLLDRAARGADAHRVERRAVPLDEALLDHQGRLAAQDQVVVGGGTGAGRVQHRVPLAQPVRVEGGAAQCALVVADRDAAVEAVHRPAVPAVLQHRDRVDEAVDDAPLPPDHEVHRPAVQQRGRRQVGGASVRHRLVRAVRRAVEAVLHHGREAVPAPAAADAHALAVLVVHDRRPQPASFRLA